MRSFTLLRGRTQIGAASLAVPAFLLSLVNPCRFANAKISGDPPPSSGAWNLTQDTTIEDETLSLDGDVWASASEGVTLTLHNVGWFGQGKRLFFHGQGDLYVDHSYLQIDLDINIISRSASFIQSDVSFIGQWQGTLRMEDCTAIGFHAIGDITASLIRVTGPGGGYFVFQASDGSKTTLQSCVVQVANIFGGSPEITLIDCELPWYSSIWACTSEPGADDREPRVTILNSTGYIFLFAAGTIDVSISGIGDPATDSLHTDFGVISSSNSETSFIIENSYLSLRVMEWNSPTISVQGSVLDGLGGADSGFSGPVENHAVNHISDSDVGEINLTYTSNACITTLSSSTFRWAALSGTTVTAMTDCVNTHSLAVHGQAALTMAGCHVPILGTGAGYAAWDFDPSSDMMSEPQIVMQGCTGELYLKFAGSADITASGIWQGSQGSIFDNGSQFSITDDSWGVTVRSIHSLENSSFLWSNSLSPVSVYTGELSAGRLENCHVLMESDEQFWYWGYSAGGEGTLEIENLTVECAEGVTNRFVRTVLQENGALFARNASLHIYPFGHSTVHAEGSDVQIEVTVCDAGGWIPYNEPSLYLEECTIAGPYVSTWGDSELRATNLGNGAVEVLEGVGSPFRLELVNCTTWLWSVPGWYIGCFDRSKLNLVDSSVAWVRLHDSASLDGGEVAASTIGVLLLSDYGGTADPTHVSVGGFLSIQPWHIGVEGAFTALTRSFPIEVRLPGGGAPVPNVLVEVLDAAQNQMWSGTTDERGLARAVLMFQTDEYGNRTDFDSLYTIRVLGNEEGSLFSASWTPIRVEVEADVTPPEITVSVSPNKLWPPNHELVDVHATVTATDDLDPSPSVVLVSITSSEPDDGLGDGDTPNDIQDAAIGTADFQFKLRAERSGRGQSRIYTVVYRATDAFGNSAEAVALVIVPHDNKKK